MQRDADGVHCPEGHADRYWNGERRDHGHPDGQQYYRDENNRCDGQHEFMAQMRDALLYDLRLIGDEVDLDIRRQQSVEAGKDLPDTVAEFDDVFALLHFNGQQQARLAVVAHHERGVLVAPLHLGKVADIDGLARAGDVHQNISDLFFRVEKAGGVQGNFCAVCLKMAGALDNIALPEGQEHVKRVREILRHALQVAGYPDLLALLAIHGQLAHFANRAQLILNRVHVVTQFAVAVALAVDREQHCHGVAEVGIDDRASDTLGQLG